MPKIPRIRTFDSTLPILLSQGYRYIQDTGRRYSTDVFRTRFLLRKTICLTGEEAARLFYREDLFVRGGVAPRRVLKTLLGKGGVHGLDGYEHSHRKEMFMSAMTEEAMKALGQIARDEWSRCGSRWIARSKVVLHSEAAEVICRIICRWAGVPLAETEARARAMDLLAMVDAFGAVGRRWGKGRSARKRSEAWIRRVVKGIRAGDIQAPWASAASTVSFHRDLQDHLLDENVAAVEILNVLRPAVAIAYLVVFGALALDRHPEWRQKLREGRGQELEYFVQEVRRFYPFAPFMGARVRKKFDWMGYCFQKGRMVLLDLYGINHDERIWANPDEFRPERFAGWNRNPFSLVPQGGGDFAGHRCAGEWATIELLKAAMVFLSSAVDYDVPAQDLDIPLTRMPALPRSGFVIENVRERPKLAERVA